MLPGESQNSCTAKVLFKMEFTYTPSKAVFILCWPSSHVIMSENFCRYLLVAFRPRFKEILIEVNFTFFLKIKGIFFLLSLFARWILWKKLQSWVVIFTPLNKEVFHVNYCLLYFLYLLVTWIVRTTLRIKF